MAFCVKCGTKQSETASFCLKCGAKLRTETETAAENETVYCRKCGSELSAEALYCPKCGNSAQVPASSGSPRTLHKWVIPVLAAAVIVIVVIALALAGVFRGSPAASTDAPGDLRESVAAANLEKAKEAAAREGAGDDVPGAPGEEPTEKASDIPEEFTYVGESGATFTVTPKHVQYRYAFGEPESAGEPLPDLAAWAPDGAELVFSEEESGYIETMYIVKTYNVDYMELMDTYCGLLKSQQYGLASKLPLQQTFKGVGMFPITIYEAGFDYIGNGSVTKNSVPGEKVSGDFTVHFYAQIDTTDDSYLFLRYPTEMGLVNPPVRFGGGTAEPTSGETMSELMTFKGARTSEEDIVFHFSGFHEDDNITFRLEDGSFQAGDVYTIEDWGETNANAIRNLEYSINDMERGLYFDAVELPERLKKVTLRILEYSDEHAIVYFHFVANDRSGKTFEAEGVGFGKKDIESEPPSDSGGTLLGKDCIVCGGKGKVKCSKCGGNGTVSKWNAAAEEEISLRCSSCGGDGQQRCSACGGTGKSGE